MMNITHHLTIDIVVVEMNKLKYIIEQPVVVFSDSSIKVIGLEVIVKDLKGIRRDSKELEGFLLNNITWISSKIEGKEYISSGSYCRKIESEEIEIVSTSFNFIKTMKEPKEPLWK